MRGPLQSSPPGRLPTRSSGVPREPRDVNDLSSLFQLREHLACGGVALVGKAPQFLEVALLGSKLDELFNRILVTAIGTFPQDGQVRFVYHA